MASKQRLDLELLTRGLVSSRQQAQQLIRAGKVRDGSGTLLDKPGTEVTPERELRVEQSGPKARCGNCEGKGKLDSSTRSFYPR